MTDPKRVLIVLPNWLGDIVMALPSVAAARNHFASQHLAVALPRAMTPVVRMLTGLDAVVSLEGGQDGFASDVATLAGRKYDVAVLFPNSFRSAWMTYRAGIMERWGYAADFRRLLLTRAVKRPREGGHHSNYYRTLLGKLKISIEDDNAKLVVTDSQRARAARLLERHRVASSRPIVVMAPGSAHGHAKQWLPERYAEVARRSVIELGQSVVFVGGIDDRPVGRAIESFITEAGHGLSDERRIVNLIGHTDLTELIGILANCEACVSNDTGAMHLAAVLSKPVVAVFGPSDERVTAPIGPHELLSHPVRCRPCLLRDCPIDHRCMIGISTNDVFSALVRCLNSNETKEASS